MPTINVRVVGVYFGWSGAPGTNSPNITDRIEVKIDDPTPTVQQLLAEITKMAANGQINGVSSFSFSPTTLLPAADLQRVVVEYNQSPKVDGSLDPGFYVLEDVLINNPERVFQYYIYDASFTQLNRDNVFTPFNKQPPSGIPDGGYVVIRQVSIATGPVSGNRVKRLSKRYVDNIQNNES